MREHSRLGSLPLGPCSALQIGGEGGAGVGSGGWAGADAGSDLLPGAGGGIWVEKGDKRQRGGRGVGGEGRHGEMGTVRECVESGGLAWPMAAVLPVALSALMWGVAAQCGVYTVNTDSR